VQILVQSVCGPCILTAVRLLRRQSAEEVGPTPTTRVRDGTLRRGGHAALHRATTVPRNGITSPSCVWHNPQASTISHRPAHDVPSRGNAEPMARLWVLRSLPSHAVASLERGGDLCVARRLCRPLCLVLASVLLNELHHVVVVSGLGALGSLRARARRLRLLLVQLLWGFGGLLGGTRAPEAQQVTAADARSRATPRRRGNGMLMRA